MSFTPKYNFNHNMAYGYIANQRQGKDFSIVAKYVKPELIHSLGKTMLSTAQSFFLKNTLALLLKPIANTNDSYDPDKVPKYLHDIVGKLVEFIHSREKAAYSLADQSLLLAEKNKDLPSLERPIVDMLRDILNIARVSGEFENLAENYLSYHHLDDRSKNLDGEKTLFAAQDFVGKLLSDAYRMQGRAL